MPADWFPLILFAAVFVVFLLRGGSGAVEVPGADRRPCAGDKREKTMFITVRTRKSLGRSGNGSRRPRRKPVRCPRRPRCGGAASRQRIAVRSEVLRVRGVQPAAAKKVLDTNVRIGTALPCRVSIYTDGGDVVLETLKPTAMLAMFGEPTLDGTAREIETAIEAMMGAAAR